jgi:hypothetical protein
VFKLPEARAIRAVVGNAAYLASIEVDKVEGIARELNSAVGLALLKVGVVLA